MHVFSQPSVVCLSYKETIFTCSLQRHLIIILAPWLVPRQCSCSKVCICKPLKGCICRLLLQGFKILKAEVTCRMLGNLSQLGRAQMAPPLFKKKKDAMSTRALQLFTDCVKMLRHFRLFLRSHLGLAS